MGPLKLTPPVDESLSELARRTATIGIAIAQDRGAIDDGKTLKIPVQIPQTQRAELFKLADLTRYWNQDWVLARAGFGGAGGGMPGLRGITFLDGDVLSTYPRDEVRGVVLRRTVHLNNDPVLQFAVGADPARAWRLEVYVNDDKLLEKLIAGSGNARSWLDIKIDLSRYRNQEVVLRLFQRVLIPHHEAGNAYWRELVLR